MGRHATQSDRAPEARRSTPLPFHAVSCVPVVAWASCAHARREVGHTWLHEPCPEMAAYQLLGQGVPERLHPKSLRATFEVATSIWASRQPRFVPHLQGPPVGIFPPSRPLSESWFIPEFSDVGMGGRTCTNLREVAAAEGLSHAARASFLIANRCRCMPGGPAAAPSTRGGGGCPAEEAVAEACARAGQTPFRDTPDLVAE